MYSDLTPKPYEECGGNEEEALTGVLSEYFPILKEWILKIVEDNKVCINHACLHAATADYDFSLSLSLQVLVCDEQHIAHNEVLAQILGLLYHLVNYGYYDDQKDIDDILAPLFVLLDGKSDTNGEGKTKGIKQALVGKPWWVEPLRGIW